MNKLLLLFSVAVSAAQAQPFLSCGVPRFGSFPSDATFQYRPTQANEQVAIRAISTTTNLGLTFSVTDSDGKALSSPVSYAGFKQFTIPTQNTVIVTVEPPTPESTTAFSILLVRLTNPCAAALNCGGAPVNDQLNQSTPNQVRMYQLLGEAGDRLLLRVAKTDGETGSSVVPAIFDPAGQPVPGNRVMQSALGLEMLLAMKGPHTVLVTEGSNRVRPVSYSIAFTRLNGACNGVALSCGSTVDASIAAMGVNAYTFNGTASDVYLLKLLPTGSSGLRPALEIRGPGGIPVQSVTKDSINYQITTGAVPYTVIVGYASATGAGSYSLAVARLNRPCGTSQALSCGSVVTGSLDGPARIRSYSFDADAGDVLLLRLLRTNLGNGIRPSLVVYDAGANLFATLAITTQDLENQVLRVQNTGTYTILASDGFNGTRTGGFSISLNRLTRPCNAVPLGCGALGQGNIDSPLKNLIYTYAAGAGDSFSVRMLDIGGTLSEGLRVYDPAGNEVRNALPGNTKGVDVVRAQGPGDYTIVATDEAHNQGPFAIEVISTKGACASAPQQGQSTSGVISGAAPFRAYALPLAAGDALSLRLAGLSPGFVANMDLYGPDGARLASPSTFSILQRTNAGGIHTVIVGANDPRRTGNFAFAWQKLNNPEGAVSLTCGQTASFALSPDAQFRYYTAYANAGDLLKLQVWPPGPRLEFYDPLGNAFDLSRKTAVSGDYVALVGPDSAVGQAGGFSLAFQKLNGPCSAISLACGQTVLRTADITGQLDAFAFSGNTGDNMTLQITSRVAGFTPFVELYDPAGTLLQSGSLAALTRRLTSGDPYTLLARSPAAGNYRVALQRGAGECPANDTEKPSVRLVRPTGGEVAPGGAPFPIAWQSDDNMDVASHSLRYSVDGGKTFTTIQASVSGAEQAYNWQVPSTVAPTRDAVIQVTATDKAGNSQTATSDPFTLIGSGFPENSSASYQYDGLNRVVQANYSDGRTIYYVYDAAGNLVQIAVQ